MIGFVLQFVPSLLLFPRRLCLSSRLDLFVLGLQGKFDEARKVASLDMSDQEAKSNMTYLRNMLSNQTQFAAAKSGGVNDVGGDDWEPFGANDAAPSKTAAAAPVATPKVRMVKASHEIETPSSVAPQRKTAKGAPPATPVKQKVAGTPTLITPVNATPAQVQASTPTASAAQGGPASLLRTDTD